MEILKVPEIRQRGTGHANTLELVGLKDLQIITPSSYPAVCNSEWELREHLRFSRKYF